MRFAPLFALAFFAFAAFAQVEVPTVIQTAGQQVKAVWTDGREAELKFSRSTVQQMLVHYEVTENLCTPKKGDIVNAVLPYRVDLLGWFWTKHSDPNRVGQILKDTLNPMFDTLIRFAIVSNDYKLTRPDMLMGLPNDTLEFSNLEWLPGFEDGQLKDFTVPEWSGETMYTNSETGVSENRVTSGAFGVRVKRTSERKAEVERADAMFTLPFTTPFNLIGDVVSWGWRNSSGPCVITFKPSKNPSVAVNEILMLLYNWKDPFQPYLAEQDSLLKDILESPYNYFLESLPYAQ